MLSGNSTPNEAAIRWPTGELLLSIRIASMSSLAALGLAPPGPQVRHRADYPTRGRTAPEARGARRPPPTTAVSTLAGLISTLAPTLPHTAPPHSPAMADPARS